MTLLVIGIFALLAGLLSLRFGRCGPYLHRHPTCKQCGFDLFGSPNESLKCSECGADLFKPRAVRYGVRRRAPRTIVGAIFFFAYGLGLVGYSGFHGWKNVKAIELKPVWWLQHDAASSNAAVRDPAIAEFSRRLGIGKLSQSQIDSVAEQGLRHQAIVSQPWLPAWGEFIEQAHDLGNLPKEKWQRYARQGVTFVLRTRPQVRRGDPIPIDFGTGPSRVASERFSMRYEDNWELRIGDITLPATESANSTWEPLFVSIGDGDSTTTILDWDGAFTRLPVGTFRVSLPIKLTMYDDDSRKRNSEKVELDVSSKTVVGELKIISADTPAAQMVVDPALRVQMQRAVSVTDFAKRQGMELTTHTVIESWRIKLQAANLPVPIAADTVLRDGGKEWRIGIAHFRSRGGIQSYLFRVDAFPGLHSAYVDVILRPNPKAAVKSLDMNPVWGEEIVIKHVKVQYVPSNHGPVHDHETPEDGPQAPETQPTDEEKAGQ